MGADRGSAEMVRGALDAIEAPGQGPFDLVLVSAEEAALEQGYRRQVEDTCRGRGCAVEILHASQQLPRDIESPLEAYKRFPDCSINVAMRRAKSQPHSAVVSPGTTGLVMTSALFTLGRVRGIDRTPIGTPLPTLGRDLFFVDGGSNVDCKAGHLYQFAVLAHLYLKHVRGVERPSIALLSNGTEDYKGNAVVKDAYELLAADGDLNFGGYVEGHTLLSGELDIMVCDGFIGNILLKFAEGVGEALTGVIREEFRRDLIAGIASKLFQRRAFGRSKRRLDYEQFGGAPLLGLNGNVVICHGRSSRKSIENALRVAHDLAQSSIATQVAQYVGSHPSLSQRNGGSV